MLIWSPIPSLCYLPRTQRASLLRALREAIAQDVQTHGSTPQLALIGTALGYCSSLLASAPADAAGDNADQAFADLEQLLTAILHGLYHSLQRTPDDKLRQELRHLFRSLFPDGGPVEPLLLARTLLKCLEQVGPSTKMRYRGEAQQLAACVQAVDEALRSCNAGAHADLVMRSRQATRYADLLIQRLAGHLRAALDPVDETQRARAAALLHPLWSLGTGQPHAAAAAAAAWG